ncbi:uncharacterized protein LOC122205203 isoform X2 [Panthera leo]|uniref:uncharacterized protein LOC122205203 isoform X2 n=1 Tax=Panthera leo TaxID=9689 RepID=UPI001C6A893D|nr:uncharacterized protein LOC122205203 isoform X2 [Panthera leo]
MCRWRQEAVGRPGHPRPSRVPGGARSLLRPGEDRPWGQRRGDGVAAGGEVPAAADRVSSSRRCLGEVTPLTPLLPGRRRPPPRFHRKPLRNPPSVPGGLGPPFRRLIAAGEYLPGRLAGGQLWVLRRHTFGKWLLLETMQLTERSHLQKLLWIWGCLLCSRSLQILYYCP